MESYMGIGRPPDEIDQGNYGQEITRYNEPLKLENSGKQPMKPNHHLRKPRLTFKCLVMDAILDKLENKLITDDVIKISSTVSVGFLSFMWELSQTYVIAGIGVGKPHSPCCSLIKGLVDVELDACLCTVVKANVLGLVNVEAPIHLGLLLDFCGMNHRDYNCQ
ncbi:Hydrophobic seed protein domain - like 5 [Theobroma cacao]|nr:Hydrophobic seed protein domain - like 5 [Theobroma cacao]